MAPEQIGSLQLEQDPSGGRNEARVARIAWLVLLGVSTAALLGLFGGGVLSTAEVSTPAGLRLEYPRFLRFGSADRIIVHLPSATGPAREIGFSRSFVENFLVENITPEPDNVRLVDAGVVYAFEGDGVGPIVLTVQARRWGRSPVRVWSGGTAVSFTVLVYP